MKKVLWDHSGSCLEMEETVMQVNRESTQIVIDLMKVEADRDASDKDRIRKLIIVI